MGKHYFVAASLLLALTACGGSEPEMTGAPPAEPAEAPQCDSVWVEGDELPADYKNCKVGDTQPVGTAVECSSGDGSVASFEDFWGKTGEPIKRFDEAYADDPDGDPPFQAAMNACLNG